MDFRDGDFAAEARSTSVPREVARAHPLDAPRVAEGAEAIVAEKAFVDPLGALLSQARDSDDEDRDGEATTATSSSDDDEATDATTSSRDDDEDREACAEWEAKKRHFVARAARAADSGADSRRRFVAAGTVRARLEALGDPSALALANASRLERQDVVETVAALRAEIKTAWREKNRLDALLLTIRVASLLDVEYPASAAAAADKCAFYPALFGLVCDVLDDAGVAIYDRIKNKSEFDDETGKRVATLPRRFDFRDVREDAKETCLNWFKKIERIEDAVPRVYLQIATLRCSRFVEDREALAARFATIVNVELVKIEDPLVGAFARAYAAKAGATLTRLRVGEDKKEKKSFLVETLRSALTDFADVVDLFDFPTYAAWKRRDRAAREAQRARENEDLIDAIENFFVDAFDDEWYAFEDDDANATVAHEGGASRSGGAGEGAEAADPAFGALAAARDGVRRESVAEAMAWSARCFARRAPKSALVESAADFLATASVSSACTPETRPMKRALNVAFARACLEAMSAEDAAAAAGAFVSLLNAASPPPRNNTPHEKDDDDDTGGVDPNVLECARLVGARVSETPPPDVETRIAVLTEAWSIVKRASGTNPAALKSFLKCAESWTDFALTHVRDEDVSNEGPLFCGGEERCDNVTTPLLRDVAAKVTSFLRRPRISTSTAGSATLDDDDQAVIERVLTRALRRERDRGDFSALFESEPFEALVSILRGDARASFFRNALRTLLYDGSCTSRSKSNDVGKMFPQSAFLEDESARVFARRAAAAAHESLSAARNAENAEYADDAGHAQKTLLPPNETDRLLVRYVDTNVCFLKSRSAFHEAFRFLTDARVAYADSDAAQRAVALSAAWLAPRASTPGVSESRFAAETAAFCRVTAMGVKDDEARVRLYLSAACAASLRGDEAATARASRLVRDAVDHLANGNRFRATGAAGDASAAETAALCAAALATLDKDSSSETVSSSSESGGRVGNKKSSRRTLGVLKRFVDERRWKDGSAHRVAAVLAVARAAAALGRREKVAETPSKFTRRRCFLLETAHACLQTAVDACETVDVLFVASDTRAAATMDVAEVVVSSFLPTAAMRDLAFSLVSRAREDASSVSGARDGRLAAVEKAVKRFRDAEADAGDTLSG
jgi:hypothetical protein